MQLHLRKRTLHRVSRLDTIYPCGTKKRRASVHVCRAISRYSWKIVHKREILHIVSNTGIYCSSDKVGTVYLVQYIFQNSTVNINALCNSREFGISAYSAFVRMCGIFHSTPTVSVSTVTTALWRFTPIHMRDARTILGSKPKLLWSEMALPRKPFGIGRTYTPFCLEWPILWPPRILSFPPGTPCITPNDRKN
jgi:hypothetical protein